MHKKASKIIWSVTAAALLVSLMFLICSCGADKDGGKGIFGGFGGRDPEDTTSPAEIVTVPELPGVTVEMGVGTDRDDDEIPAGTRPAGTNNTTNQPAESTTPTQAADGSVSTQPQQPAEGETTQPSQPEQTEPAGPEKITYAKFLTFSNAERLAYMDSFPTEDDFFLWFNTAKAEHEGGTSVEIGKDPVDMEDILNNSNPS